MELKQLYDKFISEGCNRFYIEGIGGPQSDDVECLGFSNGNWIIYYTERGQKSEPIFSTTDKNEAINYYHDHILGIEHWHIIAFTRSKDKFDFYKNRLEESGIKTIQNDIPDYKVTGDRVFRLFVTNKEINRTRDLLDDFPYYDNDLK